MKKKTSLSEEDQALFRQLMTGTRKIAQDTIVHRPQRKKISEVPVKRLLQEQADNSHYFSDEFQPLLNTQGAVKYVREDVSHFELKKLRRGDYSPELFLDLHGLTQMQAKQELGALIAACRREHVFCACVMHGHGKHILKQQTPLWLAQAVRWLMQLTRSFAWPWVCKPTWTPLALTTAASASTSTRQLLRYRVKSPAPTLTARPIASVAVRLASRPQLR